MTVVDELGPRDAEPTDKPYGNRAAKPIAVGENASL
jgi:hypothetical protein